MRRVSFALALIGAAAASGCGGSTSDISSSESNKGVPGSTYTVAVRGDATLITGGKLVSTPAGIDCGTVAGVRTSACSADFVWGTTVTLAAVPDAGNGFQYWGFGGSCAGDANCTLTANADKTVFVRFATQVNDHKNFSDPAAHGPEFVKLFTGATGALDCTMCHGDSLQGEGGVPSCSTCHPAPTVAGPAAPTRSEQCAGCHAGQGTAHQAAYDRYRDASKLAVTIDSIATDPTGVSTMTFTVTLAGQPFVSAGLAALDQKRYVAVEYDAATRKFDRAITYGSPTATATPGRYTVRATGAPYRPESANAIAYIYLADSPMTFEAFTVYDDVGHVGREYGTVNYASAANVSACQKCHGTPYMKHGYRAPVVPGLDDFASCKVCHFDTKTGGHQAWQLLVDDPAAYAAQGGVTTAAQNAKYPYKASVMNDTHMSHAMEFAYPQSMGNCATCHAGKLNVILAEANFTLAVCKSCHPVTGVGGTDPKRAPALDAVMPVDAKHESAPGVRIDLYTYTGTCNGTNCHDAAGTSPFSKIHSAYDKKIYADASGGKYSDAFKVAITSAHYDNVTSKLRFTFNATENPDIAGLAVTDIKPTVLISMYGFDTKDFLVGAHINHADGKRNLEWKVGTTGYPRMREVVPASNGTWQLEADLGTWAAAGGFIATGAVKRLEIGVMPALFDPSVSVTVALDMATRTFDLGTNGFADSFYPAIVKVQGCNSCHDALATTFHSPDRGGSVVGCRLCHAGLSGSSHLEMQSRSIDSYVHAIHAMQPFDVGDIDFADEVEELHYEHHIESTYPNFTLLNCESCHYPGTYDVPSHARSLPGVLSANDTLKGATRTIGAVGGVVSGPAARACGSCHRAKLINEDHAAELAALDAHTAAFGYRDPGTSRSVFDAVIAKVREYVDYLAQ